MFQMSDRPTARRSLGQNPEHQAEVQQHGFSFAQTHAFAKGPLVARQHAVGLRLTGEQVQEQLGPLPESTLVAAIGPQTKKDAAKVGLRVDVVARERSAESLIDAVVDAATALA